MVKIAACIVTYMSPLDEVMAAARSFLDSGVDCALTVVDNNSGAAYMEELRRAFPARFIESGANRGFGAAHNIGIQQAPPCEYYLILNPDIVIPPDALKQMLEFMDAHPEYGLMAPQVRFSDGSLQPLNKRLPTVLDLFLRRFLPQWMKQIPLIKRRMEWFMMYGEGYDKVHEVPFASGCFMLFRKRVLDQVGFFDERFFMYHEDADMTVRTNQVSRTVYYPKVYVTHLWKRGAYHSWKLTLVMIRSAFLFFHKWGWRWW